MTRLFLNRHTAHMSAAMVIQLPSPFSRTYVHPALHVGLHVRHVGATHVSKETATSICGDWHRLPADFFSLPVARPESNASVITTQQLRFSFLRNICLKCIVLVQKFKKN